MRIARGLLLAAALGTAPFIVGSCGPRGAIAIRGEGPGRLPRIRPDYTNVVIPPNIAPLNFTIQEPGKRYSVHISGDQGQAFSVSSKTPKVVIPARKWRKLLEANRGGEIRFQVAVQRGEGEAWTPFDTITNRVAEEEIEKYLVYRQIPPLYNYWGAIGIYQRDLESYDRRAVLLNRSFNSGCLNCHSFRDNHTDRMTVGIRSKHHGSSTVLVRDGTVEKVGTKFGYTSWHPSGEVVAYSANKVRQFFHGARGELRDVVDLDSDLAYYDLRTQTAKTAPGIDEEDRLETYPTWSPDGKYLYFCSAPFPWENRGRIPPKDYDKCRYDLRRISYDLETDTWGESEAVLSAGETGLSILLPRISPDGRFLIFCMCEYGCFPIFQPSSDLYIMDLDTREYRKLEINSERSESWHSWSSNSRWLAFSSKRRDGLFTRTYFSYVDESGKAHKPVLLPQKDPSFYDSYLWTYSVPELIAEPVPVSQRQLANVVTSPRRIEVESPVSFGPKRGTAPPAHSDLPWRPGR